MSDSDGSDAESERSEPEQAEQTEDSGRMSLTNIKMAHREVLQLVLTPKPPAGGGSAAAIGTLELRTERTKPSHTPTAAAGSLAGLMRDIQPKPEFRLTPTQIWDIVREVFPDPHCWRKGGGNRNLFCNVSCELRPPYLKEAALLLPAPKQKALFRWLDLGDAPDSDQVLAAFRKMVPALNSLVDATKLLPKPAKTPKPRAAAGGGSSSGGGTPCTPVAKRPLEADYRGTTHASADALCNALEKDASPAVGSEDAAKLRKMLPAIRRHFLASIQPPEQGELSASAINVLQVLQKTPKNVLNSSIDSALATDKEKRATRAAAAAAND